ncbi:hypothetical protein ACWDR3_28475 [Streptomyces sp. NPDC001002]
MKVWTESPAKSDIEAVVRGYFNLLRAGRIPEAEQFNWGYTDSSLGVEISYRGHIIEVSLGFRVRPTDAGWVLTGPATYW